MFAETEREKWASLRLLARESLKFSNFNSEQFSSLPDPAPSRLTGIDVATPPDAVFSASPGHHLPASRNLEELYSDVNGRSKKAMLYEAGLDDEFSTGVLNFILKLPHFNCRKPVCLDSKVTRVPGGEFGGGTASIVDEMEGNGGIHDETMIASDKVIQKTCELSKNASCINGDRMSGKERESTEDVHVSKGKRPHKDSRLKGILDSVKRKKMTIEIKCNGVTKTSHVGRRQEDKAGSAGVNNVSGTCCQLPVSLGGKEKKLRGKNAAESKSGSLNSLSLLKSLFGEMDNSCEGVDFLGTAKRQGLTFPRPRWWSTESG